MCTDMSVKHEPARDMLTEKLGFFRWGSIAGRMLLTTDAGDWLFLEPDEFNDLLEGRIHPEHPKHDQLRSAGILREGLNLDSFSGQMARRLQHVGRGPHLHILVLTLRCNQTCSYCHASRRPAVQEGVDMSVETAEKVVDMALQSTSPALTFEFQGGEPLLNFAVLQHVVEYAKNRSREVGKSVTFSLVSNFTAMTEEIAEWLIEHEILVCTSLDGPEELHNKNRPLSGGNAYAEVVKWIDYFNGRYIELGRDPRLWHIDALMTTTRLSLSQPEAIIEEYLARGIRSIHLRPLNPAGFAQLTWKKIGYTIEEYLDFYKRTLNHILELNLQGTELVERTASIFLIKLLTPDDPGFVDIQSPCGAGTGQVAYDHDGLIFPCDEARMVAAMGDQMFELGKVGEMDYLAMLQHPTVRSIAVASLLDTLPQCADCWNKPFCGVCPLHNFMTTGDLFAQRPRSSKCMEYMAVVTLLLEYIGGDRDGTITEVFKRWTIQRPRSTDDNLSVKEIL